MTKSTHMFKNTQKVWRRDAWCSLQTVVHVTLDITWESHTIISSSVQFMEHMCLCVFLTHVFSTQLAFLSWRCTWSDTVLSIAVALSAWYGEGKFSSCSLLLVLASFEKRSYKCNTMNFLTNTKNYFRNNTFCIKKTIHVKKQIQGMCL